jgi:hypothetical protein
VVRDRDARQAVAITEGTIPDAGDSITIGNGFLGFSRVGVRKAGKNQDRDAENGLHERKA